MSLDKVLAALLDVVPDACYAVDTSGRCVYLNRAAEILLGGDRTQIVGQSPWPADSPVHMAHQQVVNDQQQVLLELFAPAVGRWVELRIAPAGEWYVATARDIQERRDAEALLRTTEARLQSLTQASPNVFWITHAPTRRVLYVSPAYEEVWGFSIPQLYESQQGWRDAIHPEDRDRVEQAFLDLLGGGTYDLEYRVLRPDRATHWIHDRAVPLANHTGDGQQIVGIAEDITARKQAEHDRQHMWEREQAARIAAERSAERLARLQSATAAFGRALSPERVAEVVADAGMVLLGAVAASMVLMHDDGATLELLRSVGYEPEIIKNWQTFPLATPAPIADAVRRKQTIWLASLAERNEQYPHLAVAYPHAEERAWVAVPMLAGERSVGAIGLEWVGARPFNSEDEQYLQALAQQASHALERTRLYQETQAALQASEEALARLDIVLDTAPVGMALWDAELRYIHINQVLASLNGYTVQQHLGRTLPELFPQMAPMIQPMLEHVLETGETIANFEMHRRYPHTQREGDWLVSFYAVRLSSEQIVGVGAVILDITEQKRDEALRMLIGETTAAFAQALTVADVLGVLSGQVAAALDIVAMWVMRLSEDRARLEVEHAHGHPVALVERYQRVPLPGQSPITEAVQTGERIWLETREAQLARFPADAASDGPFGTWAALPLIVNGQAIGVVGLTFAGFRHFDLVQREFIHQVVQQFAQSYERARLHEAERHARTQAENAVKVRDQFLTIAAHELKTPLTSLLGNTQLLERHMRRSGTLTEREARTLGVIVAQSRRMNQMILALLDVSRIQDGQLSIVRAETDLTQLIRGIVAEVQPTLNQHTLGCKTPQQALVVMADELRLEQVLQNLVQNAIKYSPHGGEVWIELQQAEGMARIDVRDQGMGIPPSALPRLFERFYRASNADPQRISGLGIGLFVVKEIVELHGGKVSVASTEGEGSTFTVTLPLF